MFRGDVETYLYDADPDCLDHMHRNSPNEDHVLTEAVGASDGPATFYVNYDPYTSSLRAVGGVEWFYPDKTCDYVLGDALQPIKRLTVQAKTLATIRRERGLTIDYLSLDVQGAEFELLAALDDDGWRDLIAVKTEVSTRQLYAGQALFHDVCAQLHAHGFELARLPTGVEFSTMRTGLGWRGSGVVMHGDAIFLRNHQHLARHAAQPGLSLFKLAFLAVCDGNVSYALQCAMEAERHGSMAPEAEALRYVSMLRAMLHLYAAEEALMPPRFPHIWTAEQSAARFGPQGAVSPPIEEIRARYFTEVGEDRYRRLMPRLLDSTPTALEQLLMDYGLVGVAENVRRRRLEGARHTVAVVEGQAQAQPDGEIPTAEYAADTLCADQSQTGSNYVCTRVYKFAGLSITGWRTIATVTPSNVAGWAMSKVKIEVVANTNGVGAGGINVQAYISIASGAPTSGFIGSTTTYGFPPQVRLITAANHSIEVQIASPNGANYIASGFAKIEYMLSDAEGAPLTWAIR
jgi:FkbM family methyltransferase